MMDEKKVITLNDLNELIDVATIYNQSEEKWYKAQQRKRGILEWLVAMIPAFLTLAFVAWYLSGAPHTVAGISLITTPTHIEFLNLTINWAIVAPVGLELGILLVAIMKAAGWTSRMNTFIEGFLVVMAIVINLFGSLVEVQRHGGLSDLQIVAGFVIGVMMGFGIPIMTAWTGSALVKLATGQVKFDIVDLSQKWLVEGRDFFRRELYRVALNMGATNTNATKFSDRVSQQYFQNINFEEDNLGTVQTVQTVQTSPILGATMGFTAMAESRLGQSVQQFSDRPDNLPSVGQTYQNLRMTQDFVIEWIEKNPDILEGVLREYRHAGKRKTAQVLAVKMGFTEAHYKTVERVLGDKLK